MLTTGRKVSDPLGQERINQKLNNELNSQRDNALYQIDQGNTKDLTRDTQNKIHIAIMALRDYRCKNAHCPIRQAKTPHFHCPECGAPYGVNFRTWHDVINRPKECNWCRHRIPYTPAINSAIQIAKDAIDVEMAEKQAKFRQKHNMYKKARYQQAVYDAAHNLNGYWQNGSFYHNSGVVSGYNENHPDTISYDFDGGLF